MTNNATRSFADRIVIDDFEINGKQRNLKDVADGNLLVGQMRQVIDSMKKGSLVIDVELLSVEWVLQFSLENEGKGEFVRQKETEVGMTVTEGEEVSESISAKAGFSGWGFSAEVNGSKETKTFTTIETSNKTTVKDTYNVPPDTSIFVYKKKYNFRCRPWIYWDSENAWLENNGKRVEAHFYNSIIANEELITPVELTGHGRITNKPPSDLIQPTKKHSLTDDFEGSAWYIFVRKIYQWMP
ncbi:hypothetical protein LB507_006073 [Fusarium sp. FIESC RH6]|nr:hypothetical protein LB507_006073 [Fusarium sp. FIESC RH6]